MSYKNDNKQLTDFTTTYKPPTQADCAEEIVMAMTRYERKKWYEEKKYLLNRARTFARIYNKIEDKIP